MAVDGQPSWGDLLEALDRREVNWRQELARVSEHIITRIDQLDQHGSRGLGLLDSRFTDHIALHAEERRSIERRREETVAKVERRTAWRIAIVAGSATILAAVPGMIALVIH